MPYIDDDFKPKPFSDLAYNNSGKNLLVYYPWRGGTSQEGPAPQPSPSPTPTPSPTPLPSCDFDYEFKSVVFPDWTTTGNTATQFYQALNSEIINYTFDPTVLSTTTRPSTGLNSYYGSVLAKSGSTIYGYSIPYTVNYILKVDYVNETAVEVGPLLGGSNKFMGASVTPNNKIYFTPHDSTQVCVFDPETETASLFGSFSGTRKWSGSALANNNYIYCVPRDATTVLKIDPSTDTATEIGSLPSTAGKYRSCAIAKNGNIYGIPFGVSNILKIDPSTDTITTIPVSGFTGYISHTVGADGKIYMWNASNGNDVLVLDPTDDSYVYTNIGETIGRTFGSAMALDGTLAGFTSADSNEGLYHFDLSTGNITNNGTWSITNDQAGTLLLPNGKMLGTPFNSLNVNFAGDGGETLDENWVLSKYINHF